MISRLSLHNNISRLAWIYNNINTHRRNDVFARSHHIYISQMNMLILIYTRHSLLQLFLEICIDCMDVESNWHLSKNDKFIHSKIDFDIGKWIFDWQHRQDWIVDKERKRIRPTHHLLCEFKLFTQMLMSIALSITILLTLRRNSFTSPKNRCRSHQGKRN